MALRLKPAVYILTSRLTSSELDDVIEYGFAEHWQARLDYEIDSDLLKLVRLQRVEFNDGKVNAVKTTATVKRRETSRAFISHNLSCFHCRVFDR